MKNEQPKEIKVRRNTYSGKGRPKKSDYISIKPEQIRGKNSIRASL